MRQTVRPPSSSRTTRSLPSRRLATSSVCPAKNSLPSTRFLPLANPLLDELADELAIGLALRLGHEELHHRSHVLGARGFRLGHGPVDELANLGLVHLLGQEGLEVGGFGLFLGDEILAAAFPELIDRIGALLEERRDD